MLSDPEKRAKYDRFGREWQRYQQSGAPGGFDWGQWRTPSQEVRASPEPGTRTPPARISRTCSATQASPTSSRRCSGERPAAAPVGPSATAAGRQGARHPPPGAGDVARGVPRHEAHAQQGRAATRGDHSRRRAVGLEGPRPRRGRPRAFSAARAATSTWRSRWLTTKGSSAGAATCTLRSRCPSRPPSWAARCRCRRCPARSTSPSRPRRRKRQPFPAGGQGDAEAQDPRRARRPVRHPAGRDTDGAYGRGASAVRAAPRVADRLAGRATRSVPQRAASPVDAARSGGRMPAVLSARLVRVATGRNGSGGG